MHGFKAKQIPALDGLRGVAILLVITHHQLIPLSLKGGFLGVDLFFVLSGFLITSLLLKEFTATRSIALTKFYMRRALRLGPALLLYLIVSLVITDLLHPEELTRELKLVGLALVYLTNWRIALGWDYSLDPTSIIWSLSIEEQFYLLWPPAFLACLLVKLKHSHIAAGLAFVIFAVFLHRYSLWSHGAELNRLYYGTDTRADAPLVGCLIAMISVWRLEETRRMVLQIGAVLASSMLVWLIATAEFTDSFLYQGGYTFIALLAGVLIWSLANSSSGFLAWILDWYPLRWFGKISYGLYLWHWLLLKTTSFYFVAGDWDPWVRFLVALAVSAASFYLFETPFNKLKSKFTYSPSPSSSAGLANPSNSSDGPPIVTPFAQTAAIQQSQNI